MKYTVEWVPSASLELARLFADATLKNEFAENVEAIENALARRPLLVGESRGGNLRILIAPPLIVEYLVSSHDKLVVVTALRHYGKKS